MIQALYDASEYIADICMRVSGYTETRESSRHYSVRHAGHGTALRCYTAIAVTVRPSVRRAHRRIVVILTL